MLSNFLRQYVEDLSKNLNKDNIFKNDYIHLNDMFLSPGFLDEAGDYLSSRIAPLLNNDTCIIGIGHGGTLLTPSVLTKLTSAYGFIISDDGILTAKNEKIKQFPHCILLQDIVTSGKKSIYIANILETKYKINVKKIICLISRSKIAKTSIEDKNYKCDICIDASDILTDFQYSKINRRI